MKTEKPMSNRQLAALQTRKKLIEAARRIIRQKGLERTAVSEITQACGVANGTFYTYFKRKEDILFELSRDIFNEILQNAQQKQGSLLERLSYFMVRFSEHIEDSGLKLCQEWVRNTVNPNLVELPEDKQKLNKDMAALRQLLKQGVDRDELIKNTPIEMLAHTLADVLYGQMLCWDMSDGAYCFKERTQEFCDRFLASLLKPYFN